jgi:hypothetical protein
VLIRVKFFFLQTMMAEKSKAKKKHDGLWVPNLILNLFDIDEACKMLLAHFYSFGEKGCYQSNKTLAQIFMTAPRTICKRISRLSKYLYIKCPKGYYRTIWVKVHPQVSEMMEKRFNNQEQGVRTSVRSDCAKSGDSTTQDCVSGLRKNVRTTNTYTNTETNRCTAADLPMPASGQASRLLEQRRAAAREKIEQFKKRIGIGEKRERMSPEEFEKRRQMIIKQLREE